MNVAIVHYHLNRGGVTRVIANHLLAWDTVKQRSRKSSEIPEIFRRAAILFGGRDTGWPHDLADRLQSIPLNLHPIDRLDYDEEQQRQSPAGPDSAALAQRLQSALQQLDFAPHETVIHVHNHSLGKNASLPGALRLLAEDGFGLLLQVHDFAEDFRPRSYRRLVETLGTADPGSLAGLLYPQSSRIHYAVLNRRDHFVLQQAGTPEDRLHFLPNTVPDLHRPAERDFARRRLHERFGVAYSQRFVLYPVRGIRRKNVGEALLWSLLAGPETVVGMTLAPLNPAEQETYRRWKQLAAELKLPFLFECGEASGLTFEENLAAADRILTTSVAEGFGMVFLESWLAGKPLTGRDLPEITVDFTDAGLRFPNLYDRLEVPIDWVGRDRFSEALRSGLTRVLDAYGLDPLDSSRWDDLLSLKIRGGCVDFGDLHEPLQEAVLHKAAADHAARRELLEHNPVIRKAASSGDRSVDAGADVAHNQRLIREAYSLQPSGRRLLETYKAVLDSPPAEKIRGPADADRILDGFLDPARFRLIRGGERDSESPAPNTPMAHTTRGAVPGTLEVSGALGWTSSMDKQILEIIRRRSSPLQPRPAGPPCGRCPSPELAHLSDIRAVLWDVYGTLFISASGEVGTVDMSGHAEAFCDALGAVAIPFDGSGEEGVALIEAAIHESHEASRREGIVHPEVDIVEIWRVVLGRLCETGLISDARLGDDVLRRLAVEYEVRTNPVWPMPGCEQCLADLREAGLLMGIVSNAQFFTPALFPALLDAEPDALGFHQRLQYYSYQFLQAKPGRFMFDRARQALSELGVEPAHVLYVGNDVLNDVRTADEAGFRTALFAGDQRSLRLREGDPRVAGVTPDLVLTALDQLAGCVIGASSA